MEDLKDKVKKSIFGHLKRFISGVEPLINPQIYTKKGLSKKDIAEIKVDFALETNFEDVHQMDKDFFFESDDLTLLLNDEKTKEKVIKLFERFSSVYNLRDEIFNLLHSSNFNLYFLIGLEGFYDFTERFSNRQFDVILEYVTKHEMWNESSVKRFFIYFCNNPAYLSEFNKEFEHYFPYMGETLQRFLVYKTDFSSNIGSTSLIKYLDDSKISDVVKRKLVYSTNVMDEDIGDIVRIYLNIPEEYKKTLFPTEKDFYMWLGDSERYDEVFEVLDDMFIPDRVEMFFRYNPNWVSNVDSEDEKVKLKYQIRGVPDFVKDQIKLPYTKEIPFDGEDVKDMFADYSDSPSVWVRYYVDEELYDRTMSWDYNPDESTIKQYYWDDLTPENLNKIKEILKKNNPDLDLDDEDAVQEAAFEDSKIKSALYSAAEDGERSGDESKLIDDIKEGIDELFGKGNWRHTEPGVIKAKVDISQFDESHLLNAFHDCGEWDIRCMFFTIRKEYFSHRDMPSLPEYRYGIQGDFDKSQFNDYIEGNL